MRPWDSNNIQKNIYTNVFILYRYAEVCRGTNHDNPSLFHILE